ncbi:MAG TPA: YbaK/EbsC family protein [Micrococcaceae bacterium]|nr:YbaK/EbsC family protein [Micrococcaceae bacterium]
MFVEPIQNVKNALSDAGAQDTVTVLDESVPTAAAAAVALNCEVGAIANSLVFELEGKPLLILASGAGRVNTNLVSALLGLGKIKRASPGFVHQHTGQQVGGVAPVGHPEKIPTILDTSLEQYPVLWAGAGEHNAMFSISYEELARITDARPLQVR